MTTSHVQTTELSDATAEDIMKSNTPTTENPHVGQELQERMAELLRCDPADLRPPR